MSTLTIRWDNPTALTLFVDGQLLGGASDDDDFPDEPLIPLTRTVAVVAEMVARALGADCKVEKP